MNYLKLTLFLVHIYLETSILPKYLTTAFSSTGMLFSILLIGGFLTIFTLRKFSKLFVFVLLFADLILGYYLIQTFYIPSLTFSGEALVFFIYFLIAIVFLLSNKIENYAEFKTSENLKTFAFFLINLISSYLYFYHFKNIHSKTVRRVQSIDNLDYIQTLTHFGVDFLIFFNLFSLMTLLKMRYSKSKKKFYFFNIIKRVFLLILMTIIFYANYNNYLNNLIYAKFNEYVPHPHNVVVYNSMPLDADMRFRLAITSLLYLIL